MYAESQTSTKTRRRRKNNQLNRTPKIMYSLVTCPAYAQIMYSLPIVFQSTLYDCYYLDSRMFTRVIFGIRLLQKEKKSIYKYHPMLFPFHGIMIQPLYLTHHYISLSTLFSLFLRFIHSLTSGTYDNIRCTH